MALPALSSDDTTEPPSVNSTPITNSAQLFNPLNTAADVDLVRDKAQTSGPIVESRSTDESYESPETNVAAVENSANHDSLDENPTDVTGDPNVEKEEKE